MCKEGYKMTGLGCLPEDWEVISMNQILEKYNRKSFPISEEKIASVGKGTVYPRKEIYYNKKVKTNAPMLHLYPFSIVFGLGSNEISYGFNYDKECWVSPAYHGFIVKRSIIDYDFLKYIFEQYKKIWSKIYLIQGVRNGKQINWGGFLSVFLPLPPFDEQKRIAETLKHIEDDIKETEQKIMKAKELKKAFLKKLLTEGIGHTEFKETEIGRIPKDWQVVKLGDVVEEFIRGVSYNKNAINWESNKGIPVLRATNLEDIYQINIDQSKLVWLNPNQIVVKKEQYIQSDDIIIVTSSGSKEKVGRITLVKKDYSERYAIGAFLGIIRLKDSVEVSYVFFWLLSNVFRKYIENTVSGTNINNLRKEHLTNFLLPLPPLPEQKKIAEILQRIDNYIIDLEKSLNLKKQLFKAMTNELVTGKIRLNKEQYNEIVKSLQQS